MVYSSAHRISHTTSRSGTGVTGGLNGRPPPPRHSSHLTAVPDFPMKVVRGTRMDSPSCLWRRIPFRWPAGHDVHPFDHAGEGAWLPTTRHAPAHAPTAGATRRGRVRGTSRQRSPIRRLGAPRSRKGRIAVRLEGSSVRAQSRFGSGCESCHRKSEECVPRSAGSPGTPPLRSGSWGEFPRVENRVDDRRGEDRVGWSHDIVVACRASDGGGGTRAPRARAAVPAVGWTLDAPGVRLVVRRVGRILWVFHTRRAFRRAADVSCTQNGTHGR